MKISHTRIETHEDNFLHKKTFILNQKNINLILLFEFLNSNQLMKRKYYYIL